MATSLRAVIRGERPVHTEPMQADETMVTRHNDKIPTVEIPFPEAEMDATPAPLGTNPTPQAAAAAAALKAPTAIRRQPRQPVSQKFKTTLTNVRAMPLWRRTIPTAIFAAIIALFAIGLITSVVAIRKKSTPPITKIDTKVEKERDDERKLRMEGNALYEQHKYPEAYAKFQELQRRAPNSTGVAEMLQKIRGYLQQAELGRQQLVLAKQKFDEGMALFNQKKFAESVLLFADSVHINPSSDEATKYLQLAQQEQQRVEGERAAAAAKHRATTTVATTTTVTAHGTTTAGTHTTAGGDGGHATNAAPVQVTTVFNSPFADGTLTVKIGSQVILREPIWEERGKLIFKRKTGKSLNIAKEIAPVNADVEVWVEVPSLNIKEYRMLPRINFQPGSAHRLTITADANTRKFDYSLN